MRQHLFLVVTHSIKARVSFCSQTSDEIRRESSNRHLPFTNTVTPRSDRTSQINVRLHRSSISASFPCAPGVRLYFLSRGSSIVPNLSILHMFTRFHTSYLQRVCQSPLHVRNKGTTVQLPWNLVIFVRPRWLPFAVSFRPAPVRAEYCAHLPSLPSVHPTKRNLDQCHKRRSS